MAAKKPNPITKNPEVVLAALSVVVFIAVCIITLTSIESMSPADIVAGRKRYVQWYQGKTKREINVPEARDYKDIFDNYIEPGDKLRIPHLEKWLFYRRPTVQIERKNVLAYFLGKIKVTPEPDFGKITIRITLEELDAKYKVPRDPMTLRPQEYDHVDDDSITVRLYGGRMTQDKIEWNSVYTPKKTGRGEWTFEEIINTSGAEERFYWVEAEAEFPDAVKIGKGEYPDGTTVIPPTKVVVVAPPDDPETQGRISVTECRRAETKRIFSLQRDFSTGNKISIKVTDNQKGETYVTKPRAAGEAIDGTDYQILNIVTITPESRVIVDHQGNIEQIRILLEVYNAASPDRKITVTISEFNDLFLAPRPNDKIIEAATERLRKEFERIGTGKARFHPRRGLMKGILKLAARLSLKNLRDPKDLKDALNNPIPACKAPAGPWQNRAMLVKEFNDLFGEKKESETVIVYIAPKGGEEKDAIQYYILHRKEVRRKLSDTITGPYECALGAEYANERTVDRLFEIVKNDVSGKIGDDGTFKGDEMQPKVNLEIAADNAKSRVTASYLLDKLTGQPAGPYLHYFDNNEEKPYIDFVPSEAVEPEAPPPFVPGDRKVILNTLEKSFNVNTTQIGPKNISEHIDYLAGLWKLEDKIIVDKSVQDIEGIMDTEFPLSLQSPETTGKQLLDRIIEALNDQLEKDNKPYNVVYVVNGKIVIKVESP